MGSQFLIVLRDDDIATVSRHLTYTL